MKELNLDFDDSKEAMAKCHCPHVARLMILFGFFMTLATGVAAKVIGNEIASHAEPVKPVGYPNERTALDRVDRTQTPKP